MHNAVVFSDFVVDTSMGMRLLLATVGSHPPFKDDKPTTKSHLKISMQRARPCSADGLKRAPRAPLPLRKRRQHWLTSPCGRQEGFEVPPADERPRGVSSLPCGVERRCGIGSGAVLVAPQRGGTSTVVQWFLKKFAFLLHDHFKQTQQLPKALTHCKQ